LAASSRRASSACPRGEDPATSVARELLAETGYTVKNVRPAGVGPLQIDWPETGEALLPEKQRERGKQFKGDQSHFFFGDVAGPPVEAVDPSGFKDVRSRRPYSLHKLFAAYSGPANPCDACHAGLLNKRIAERAKRSKSAGTALGSPDRRASGDLSKVKPGELLGSIVQHHQAHRRRVAAAGRPGGVPRLAAGRRPLACCAAGGRRLPGPDVPGPDGAPPLQRGQGPRQQGLGRVAAGAAPTGPLRHLTPSECAPVTGGGPGPRGLPPRFAWPVNLRGGWRPAG
jgi:hypothetical protein